MKRVAVALALALSSLPFFLSTTAIGDDHIFLAFARLAPNPLVAFVRDQHGGEYYRPLPMLVWWLLGRAGGGAFWPFAALALALHTAVSLEIAALIRRIDPTPGLAALSGLLFFLSPAAREAAFWYSASTDLLSTAATLASIIFLLDRRPFLSVLCALAAFLSKEAAFALPALGFVAAMHRHEGAAPAPPGPSVRLKQAALAVLPHLLVAAAVFAARRLVLGGPGGAADEHASVLGKLVQISSGLVHAATASDVLPEPVAWGAGLLLLLLGLVLSIGDARRHVPVARFAWLWMAVACAPLLAASWVVGARYFYLPAVGLMYLEARVLFRLGRPAMFLIVLLLAGLGAGQGVSRSREVSAYERRVAAARRAVLAGVRDGHRTFHVSGGIKDLDLVLKHSADLRAYQDQILVLPDVPASFVLLPPGLAAPVAKADLVASPPIPPSGAYTFDRHRIVGLARRGDEPGLEEVLASLPDLRFIRLRATPGGHVIARDATDEVREAIGSE